VPESISRQVLGSLTQFSRKASRLGLVGLIAVVVASLALLVTIDRTLGQMASQPSTAVGSTRPHLLGWYHARASAVGGELGNLVLFVHGLSFRFGRLVACISSKFIGPG